MNWTTPLNVAWEMLFRFAEKQEIKTSLTHEGDQEGLGIWCVRAG